MHFHRDVMAACDCWPPHVLRPTADDVFIGSPPLAFTFGLGGLLLFPLRVGASTVLLEKVTPPDLLAGDRSSSAPRAASPRRPRTAPCDALQGKPWHDDARCASACRPARRCRPPRASCGTRPAGIEMIDGIGSTEMLHIFISADEHDVRPGATGKVRARLSSPACSTTTASRCRPGRSGAWR